MDLLSQSVEEVKLQAARNVLSIEEITAQLRNLKEKTEKCSNDITRQIQSTVALEMKKAGASATTSEEVDKLVKEKLTKVDKELDRVKAIGKAAQLNRRQSRASCSSTGDEDQMYWYARRCARISPVPGAGPQLWANAGKFFNEKMNVPTNELDEKMVESIERVSSGRRKNKIQDEVLVVFNSVRARDMVASYAPNLAQWRHSKCPANFRLEIPDHLRHVFLTLEGHAHILRKRFGVELKRHIKYDDMRKTLVMDVCPKKDEE